MFESVDKEESPSRGKQRAWINLVTCTGPYVLSWTADLQAQQYVRTVTHVCQWLAELLATLQTVTHCNAFLACQAPSCMWAMPRDVCILALPEVFEEEAPTMYHTARSLCKGWETRAAWLLSQSLACSLNKTAWPETASPIYTGFPRWQGHLQDWDRTRQIRKCSHWLSTCQQCSLWRIQNSGGQAWGSSRAVNGYWLDGFVCWARSSLYTIGCWPLP